MLLVLLVAGAGALERAGVLPAPAAAIVVALEGWLDPLLREAGIDLPRRPELPAPNALDDRAAVREALALLSRLPVAPERPGGYKRDDWPHWLDADGDCQDTRQEVLLAESLGSVRLSASGCAVAAGRWRDGYTGEVLADPRALSIDHVVPLAEAYRSGGVDWSRERRAAYANDLADPRTLRAVTSASNGAKGDRGPEAWLPPDPARRCRYVADWVAIKARWSLAMDQGEQEAAEDMLRRCAGR